MEDNTYQDIFNNNNTNNISGILYKNSNSVPANDYFVSHAENIE